MKKAILGKKLGMTQIFDETGLMVPVTVVEAGPMTVVRNKTVERDGYAATVVAFEDRKEALVNKPQKGVFDKAGVKPKKYLKEFKYSDSYEVGAEIKCDMFAAGDVVDVSGVTKGHGFSGAIKRWNQHRLKMTHGTGPVHRSLGSVGANSTQQGHQGTSHGRSVRTRERDHSESRRREGRRRAQRAFDSRRRSRA